MTRMQHMEREVADKVFYYYCWSDALLSPPSSHQTLIRAREGALSHNGQKMDPDPMNDGLLDVICHRRRIQRALSLLSELDQQILFAHFASHQTPYYFAAQIPLSKEHQDRHKYLPIQKVFKELSPTAILLSGLSLKQLNDTCKANKLLPNQTTYLTELKAKAQKQYQQTIQTAYHLLKGIHVQSYT